jgi:branched-chain amino acid aminotransferase
MSRVYDKAFFEAKIVPVTEASLSITSSAVLYGLSVYTVLPVCVTSKGLAAFRVGDHYRRLVESARIIGIDTFEPDWTEAKFLDALRAVVKENNIKEDAFLRATVHVIEEVPGVRTRNSEDSPFNLRLRSTTDLAGKWCTTEDERLAAHLQHGDPFAREGEWRLCKFITR